MSDLPENQQNLLNITADWSKERLLKARGLIALSDASRVLGFQPSSVKRAAKKSRAVGKETGVFKIKNRYVVRIEQFAAFYQDHLLPRFIPVSTDWDRETLLAQDGTFRLSEVCRRLPFSAELLRAEARRLKDARGVMGVYKDPALRTYLVEMPVFKRWIGKLYLGPDPARPKQNSSGQ